MQRWHGMSTRPLGVTIIGLFNLLVTAAVLLGYLILGLKVPPISLAATIILFANSLGMLAGFTWAWYLTIIIYVGNIIYALIMLFSQFPTIIIQILLSMLIIFYFTWGNVRRYFSVGSSPCLQ
jgi:hypothetical protein